MRRAVSERIRKLCDEQELSSYQLAYDAMVPVTTLMNIINGATKNPGLFTIIKICDALGVSLAEFFDTDEFDVLLQEMEEEIGLSG